jgi:hypothetical protein
MRTSTSTIGFTSSSCKKIWLLLRHLVPNESTTLVVWSTETGRTKPFRSYGISATAPTHRLTKEGVASRWTATALSETMPAVLKKPGHSKVSVPAEKTLEFPRNEEIGCHPTEKADHQREAPQVPVRRATVAQESLRTRTAWLSSDESTNTMRPVQALTQGPMTETESQDPSRSVSDAGVFPCLLSLPLTIHIVIRLGFSPTYFAGGAQAVAFLIAAKTS